MYFRKVKKECSIIIPQHHKKPKMAHDHACSSACAVVKASVSLFVKIKSECAGMMQVLDTKSRMEMDSLRTLINACLTWPCLMKLPETQHFVTELCLLMPYHVVACTMRNPPVHMWGVWRPMVRELAVD